MKTSMNQTSNETHWYDSKLAVHLLLFFFFPVGLFALWKSNTIAKWWKFGATTIVALFVAIGFSGKDSPQAVAGRTSEASETTTGEEIVKPVAAGWSQSQKDSIIAASKAQIEVLKKKFNYTADEFQKVGFYKHKTFGESYPDRKTLTVGLNSEGYIYLRSNYHADDWLFHKSVQIKSGETILESPTIESYDKAHVTYNSGGDIWEQNTYKDDNGIIYLISISQDNEVKVRFNGQQFYSDIVLSKKDKQAIKDSYELSQAIRVANGSIPL